MKQYFAPLLSDGSNGSFCNTILEMGVDATVSKSLSERGWEGTATMGASAVASREEVLLVDDSAGRYCYYSADWLLYV